MIPKDHGGGRRRGRRGVEREGGGGVGGVLVRKLNDGSSAQCELGGWRGLIVECK